MRPFYDDGSVCVLQGDSREMLGHLQGDVIVADPPYGLAFMGKAWDQVDQAFHQAWATAAYQALPPGGWLLAFGGTRTWHRLACGIEDAGFEIRDTLMWLYGQGFPKGKACLKPGWEPILLARKPGSSVLQIDAARVGHASPDDLAASQAKNPGRADLVTSDLVTSDVYGAGRPQQSVNGAGRWPPNVALVHDPGCVPVGVRKIRGSNGIQSPHAFGLINDDGWKPSEYGQQVGYADPDGTETITAWDCQPGCPVFLLDQQSGERQAGRFPERQMPTQSGAMAGPWSGKVAPTREMDSGGASRFFYTAKAGRAERVTVDGEAHPTVKPLALMRWLVRLVTPPGGTVLDPFCGSGSTLVAATLEGRKAIGIEVEERYCQMAVKRLESLGQGVLALDGATGPRAG